MNILNNLKSLKFKRLWNIKIYFFLKFEGMVYKIEGFKIL